MIVVAQRHAFGGGTNYQGVHFAMPVVFSSRSKLLVSHWKATGMLFDVISLPHLPLFELPSEVVKAMSAASNGIIQYYVAVH